MALVVATAMEAMVIVAFREPRDHREVERQWLGLDGCLQLPERMSNRRRDILKDYLSFWKSPSGSPRRDPLIESSGRSSGHLILNPTLADQNESLIG